MIDWVAYMKKIITFLYFGLLICFCGCSWDNSPKTNLHEDDLDESPTFSDVESEMTYNDVNERILKAYNSYVDFLGDEGQNIQNIMGFASDDVVFSLEYINGDDIPELVLGTKNAYRDSIYILSFINNKVVCDGVKNVMYMDIKLYKSVVATYNANMFGGYSYRYYKINDDGMFEFLCGFEETLEENSKNDENPLKQSYYIDNEEVSFEKYNEYVSAQIQEEENKRWDANNSNSLYDCTIDNFLKLRAGELR